MSASTFPHEDFLQLIWSQQAFARDALVTLEGEPVTVDFPGWRNQGEGPDFKEARLTLGSGDTSRRCLGAVEVHWRSSGWTAHRHHENPAYNAVVLHVILYGDPRRPTYREDGQPVPQLELAPYLSHQLEELQQRLPEWREQLRQQDTLPGRCGASLRPGQEAHLRRVVAHAAEQRLLARARRLQERWTEEAPEELLFQQLFKALGQTAHAARFEELALRYPLRSLEKALAQPWRTSRPQVLSVWFGACGLLEGTPPEGADPTLRREFLHWKMLWEAHPNPQPVQAPSQRYRPQHAPEHRLLALFHHLQHTQRTGLLRAWLQVLLDLKPFAASVTLRTEALARTAALWTVPDWEPWNQRRGTSGQAGGPVGRDRQVLLWANALLPFFVAYARERKEEELERLLFRLFLALPGEASNQKLRFMQHRLHLSQFPTLKLEGLGERQGLLELHKDFCHNFHEGCLQCRLPELLD